MKVPFNRSILSSLVLMLLSACGSSGVTQNPSTNSQPQNNSIFDSGSSGGANYKAYSYTFSLYGNSPSTVTPTTLTTDTKFVARLTANPAGKINADSTFIANYNCVQFKVSAQTLINGNWTVLHEDYTSFLTVPGGAGCTGGVANQTIDYSPYLTPGHGDVRVVVTAYQYDYYCSMYNRCLSSAQLFWSPSCSFAHDAYGTPNNSAYYCPGHAVQANHNIAGTLDVQINGTDF